MLKKTIFSKAKNLEKFYIFANLSNNHLFRSLKAPVPGTVWFLAV